MSSGESTKPVTAAGTADATVGFIGSDSSGIVSVFRGGVISRSIVGDLDDTGDEDVEDVEYDDDDEDDDDDDVDDDEDDDEDEDDE